VRLTRNKEWRESRGFTQKELAAQAGVGEATVARIELGASVLPNTARKLAEAMGVTVVDLMENPPVPKVAAPPSHKNTGEERRIFDVVHELVTRQIEEDRQAIARAGESELAQGSTVRHENEARDRLLQYHPADVAELAVDLMRRVVHMEQELKRIQTGVSQPDATKAIAEAGGGG
jgi:transcriptional regulator with XRE-family HTH domain